jgi:hypothetical protein
MRKTLPVVVAFTASLRAACPPPDPAPSSTLTAPSTATHGDTVTVALFDIQHDCLRSSLGWSLDGGVDGDGSAVVVPDVDEGVVGWVGRAVGVEVEARRGYGRGP